MGNLQGRNIIVTGGNAGIGLATSMDMAKRGANVFIITRNKDKAMLAVEQIKNQTGNKNISYFTADLSSQKSIRAVAGQVRNGMDKVDVLINNAGGVFPEFKLTEDGLESTIATNHFAYFLLTNLLLDMIKKSDYARIVNVASRSHENGSIDFDSFTQDKRYFILKAYAQSKLANVLFSNEMASRLKGSHVTINSLHPGLVKTDIGMKGTQWYSNWVWSTYSKLFGISIEKGAATSIYLATSDKVQGISGRYFSNCKEKTPQPLALDTALQKQLWDVSEQYCPLR